MRHRNRAAFVVSFLVVTSTTVRAQPTPAAQTPPEAGSTQAPSTQAPSKKLAWYERIGVRGYTQVRFNRILVTNDAVENPQGDRYMTDNNGFGIRRARVILSGDMTDHLYIYLQPDFASVINDQLHVAILRDWYADISLDKEKNFRFRVGQSKVPYGFENMQSSSNRLPFDRSDALNSALKDERDLGIFFYWATTEARRRFKMLVDDGYKGSGDYGVFALGVYNGQTANRPEVNDNKHVVARLAYPFFVGSQIIELGMGGYTGKYVVKHDSSVGGGNEFRDMRGHVSFILYPKPFGLQAEYNVGVGPALVGNTIREEFLHGGYVLASLRLGNVIPYARGVLYDGGKKFETNAPKYHVREVEAGIEWEALKWVELTGAVLLTRRTVPAAGLPLESGRVVRLQLQFNY